MPGSRTRVAATIEITDPFQRMWAHEKQRKTIADVANAAAIAMAANDWTIGSKH